MEKLSFRYRHQKISYQFSVLAPYQPGHRLTAGEAQALNQLRAENIRENMRKAFANASAGVNEILPADAILRVQKLIEAYDAEYQFPESAESAERLGAIEKEAKMLAVARSPEGTSDEEIQALAESIDLVAEARQRVAARAEIAKQAMEELLS